MKILTPWKKKWEIVNRAFTVEDTFMIEGFKREFAFGPSTRQVCNCKGCEGQQKVGFRFSLLEFLPSDYDSRSIRARILYARPTRDAAKRAKENLLPRSSVVATEASEKLDDLAKEQKRIQDNLEAMKSRMRHAAHLPR